jgi:hypothetical protein
VRLRPLTEAECYARCYGGVRSEQVSVLRPTATTSKPEPRGRPEQERGEQPQEEAA